jgi:hypothetical protein
VPARVSECSEPIQVHRAAVGVQAVAPSNGLHPRVSQRTPKIPHIPVDKIDRRRRRLLPPQRINDAALYDRSAAMHQQQRQQRPHLRRRNVDLGPVAGSHPQRAEQPELHGPQRKIAPAGLQAGSTTRSHA